MLDYAIFIHIKYDSPYPPCFTPPHSAQNLPLPCNPGTWERKDSKLSMATEICSAAEPKKSVSWWSCPSWVIGCWEFAMEFRAAFLSPWHPAAITKISDLEYSHDFLSEINSIPANSLAEKYPVFFAVSTILFILLPAITTFLLDSLAAKNKLYNLSTCDPKVVTTTKFFCFLIKLINFFCTFTSELEDVDSIFALVESQTKAKIPFFQILLKQKYFV